jgi:hypothetical protein
MKFGLINKKTQYITLQPFFFCVIQLWMQGITIDDERIEF